MRTVLGTLHPSQTHLNYRFQDPPIQTTNPAMDSINLSSLRLADPVKPPPKSRIAKTKKKQADAAGSSSAAESGGAPTAASPNTPAVEIVAYSQQSRFHRETFDASNIDIDLKGVHLSVNDTELLVDAHLRLKPGVRYGMIGQNGVGKSVLMSVLGNDVLVGLPQNVRILHIAQLEDRGHTARQALLAAERELAQITAQEPQTYVTAGMAHAVMSEIFGAYEVLDVEADEARAKAILRGLGFAEGDLLKEGRGIGGLSGGWRMRVMLAKALYIKPDILLLDEPTNHLDLPAIVWLQSYLENETEDQTVVIVSHDRNFLDAVTEETIIFRDKKLTYHAGNYEDWERTTEEQRKRKTRLKDLEQKRRAQINASIQKNVQRARTTGDDKRLGLVASRKKKLERMGMERLEDGKRYKESYHGYREAIVVDQGIKTAPIQLPPPSRSRSPGLLPPAPNAAMVINNVSLDVGPYARIGLLGPNGCGKSTLMNLLAGALPPTRGAVRQHHRLRIGYFSQHTVDQLDPALSALQHLAARYPEAALTDGEARAHLGACGISGAPVARTLRTLSGGQRNRVALALVTFHRPHVLLLDEITNHLDMGTVASLVEALCAFAGALVVQVIEGDPDDEDEEGDAEGGPPPGCWELKVWEKGLEAYVEKIQRLSAKGLQGAAKP
ncbi:P-loop containing nucleoside triphosphate hydrolase protein [Pholiota molesta]|nr:P-loop containing nucleoside triphosphate hydrolase protein [Pholiota molesta]